MRGRSTTLDKTHIEEDDGADDELMSAERDLGASAAQLVQLAAASQGSDEANCTRMAQMCEVNIKQQEAILTSKLQELRILIDEETTSKVTGFERKFDTAFDEMQTQMQTVIGRMAALEKREPMDCAAELEGTIGLPAAARPRQDGWKQDSLIFGGWSENWGDSNELDFTGMILQTAGIRHDDYVLEALHAAAERHCERQVPVCSYSESSAVLGFAGLGAPQGGG